jgi:hypothetical protein
MTITSNKAGWREIGDMAYSKWLLIHLIDPKSCDYSKTQHTCLYFVIWGHQRTRYPHDVVVFDVRSFVGEEISGIRAKRVVSSSDTSALCRHRLSCWMPWSPIETRVERSLVKCEDSIHHSSGSTRYSTSTIPNLSRSFHWPMFSSISTDRTLYPSMNSVSKYGLESSSSVTGSSILQQNPFSIPCRQLWITRYIIVRSYQCTMC